jgi:tetratricopeptide (TPR) repeat protein
METTCGFIDGAIEAGEIAAAREALQHHFNILTKEPKVVEELFGKLRKAAPYDTSILQVMREFYDLTNDRAKLDEVENLLRLATPEVKSPATAQSAPEVDFSVSSGDMELDISGIGSADELFSTPATLSAVPSPPASPTPAAVIPPPAPRATPPVTWEEDIEIDVDLDGYDSVQTMGNVERALDDEVEELDELADMDLMEPIELDLEPANDQGGYVTLGSLLDEDDEDGQIALSEDELLAEDEAVDIDELALPDINNLFDLGSDFSLPAEPASKRGGKYSSSGVLSAFRQSVDQQLDKQDTDTHYNLGIAYKEMGLFNDAVTEFTYASFDPGRKIDCMTLKGICYRESGDLEKAEELFRSALAYDSLSGEEHLSISYELALLLEADSRHGEAEAMYQQIIEADPSFQDASRRLARLQGNDTGQELLGSDGLDIELEEVE